MVSFELRLRLDYDILGRVRKQNWDLSVMHPGFIIQFSADHIDRQYRQLSRPINANNRLPRKFVFMEDSLFLSYQGMRHFLSNILHGQHVPLSPNGQILCDGGLQFVRLDSTGSVILYPPSLPIHSIKKLVDCVLHTCKLMKNSPRIRKLVPIAIDMGTVQYQQQFQRVESVAINRNEPWRIAKMAEAPVVEEKIKVSYQEKDCSICLEKLSVGQKGGRLSCTHVFHKKCIVPWLEKSSSCPLCRAPADFSSSPTDSNT
ncbi:hypothetical protein ACOSP7_010471 [Xanthoceras sorbifolium]|uniref:RING-type domain-containing protein n=1 Tax=Xanthoceras sorbifolium TaxID=99658 RepID=A0ABQ8H071_9ROSI|nr:hypothetical protein JRO89_XSUnG0028700 [Xanthoceras sorbifolium]